MVRYCDFYHFQDGDRRRHEMSELHRIWLVIEDLEHVLAPLKRLGPTRFAARGAEHVDVTGPHKLQPP